MGRAFEYRQAAKEKRWDKMSKIFPKLAKAITVAAKEGGSDPAMNAKLRTAIANAKTQNIQKTTLTRQSNEPVAKMKSLVKSPMRAGEPMVSYVP